MPKLTMRVPSCLKDLRQASGILLHDQLRVCERCLCSPWPPMPAVDDRGAAGFTTSNSASERHGNPCQATYEDVVGAVAACGGPQRRRVAAGAGLSQAVRSQQLHGCQARQVPLPLLIAAERVDRPRDLRALQCTP